MSIFDVFKARWSAKEMSDDDRRKIFWYLKRTSSYTTWKARADAFDRFAAVVERQVREEPVVMVNPAHPEWATNWEDHFVRILKGQVLYEQGLARLRSGDRTVWHYSEQGVLWDAVSIHGHWWTALVNHGPQGDVYLRGKYVDEMTAAIDDLSLQASAGVVQAVLAEPPAAHLWSPGFIARLDRTVPFPQSLPEVPVPIQEVVVRTREAVPCYGIFEPQVEDGCMNYLLEGVPAPKAVNRGGVTRAAVWRLVWQDTRYLDGSIPEEEQLYFRFPEDSGTVSSVPIEAGAVISRKTNQQVVKAGIWVVDDRLDVRQRFELGDRLPQFEGRDVGWIWVSKN